jgi:hypothetical protein
MCLKLALLSDISYHPVEQSELFVFLSLNLLAKSRQNPVILSFLLKTLDRLADRYISI